MIVKFFFKKKSVLFIVLAFFCIACALFLEKTRIYTPISSQINTEAFRNVLNEKEDYLDIFLDTLIAKTNTSSFKEIVKYNYPEFNKDLKKRGLAVFIYENDSLKFWSDNAIPVINKYSGSTFSNRIVFLQNAWYKVLHRTFDCRTIVGLILIKYKYQYENEFLKNEFHSDFNIESSVNISLDTTKSTHVIRDVNNNFLFSLIPSTELYISSSAAYISIGLYMIGIIILLVLGLRFFAVLKEKKKKHVIWLLFAGAAIVLLRYIMIEWKLPEVFYTLKLFDPQYYAQSFFFGSLGDFLLNAVCVFYLTYAFYKTDINLPRLLQGRKAKMAIYYISSIIVGTLFFFLHISFENLILNSSISFEVYKVFNINFFSVIGFSIIAFLLASHILVTEKFYSYFSNLSIWHTLASMLLASCSTIPLYMYFGESRSIYPLVFLLLLCGSLIYIHYKKLNFNYYLLLLLIFISSLYIATVVLRTTFEKEINIRKVLVVNLANERDLVAELFLQDISLQLKDDKAIKNYLRSPYMNQDDLHQYMQKEYFKGFWNKYIFKIHPCSVRDSLFIEPDYKMSHCFTFFGDMIEKYGISIPKTNFYFLDNVNGRINYLGVLKYKIYASNLRVTLYVELASKLVTEELGYPELLLDKKMHKKSNISEYSYAKYRNFQLLSQIGACRYNLSAESYTPKNEEFNFTESDGFSHLIYNADKSNMIILSRPEFRIIDGFISLSYIFVFFFILTNLILLGSSFRTGFRRQAFNLQARIQISMILLLFLSMLLIGGGMVYYNMKQYKVKNYEDIREKIQSAVKELEGSLGGEFDLQQKSREQLTVVLTRLSDIFSSDINLYDTKGNILATSRPEIFEKGLIGTKMNMEALSELLIHKRAEYIHDENIGFLTYQSAYVPFKNNNGRLLAYLNLPYFTRQAVIKKELTSFIVAIINIYVLLILVSVIIAIFLASRLTKPLALIQRKLGETGLGRQNEFIEYKGKDEIGSLIKEYNRMVSELSKSAELLAKSERESAWREMAKQIAHEIKNPLTPMKLSIQYLQRVWKDNKPEKEELMERVTRTLVEQIDTLSAIATEFSNFAKMPKPVNERLNLVSVVETSLDLFRGNEAVDFEFQNSHDDEYFVTADREQMTRVFNNLIKNAIQAIPDGKRGRIIAAISSENNNIIVRISDNGYGIAEEMVNRIFMPNFTTKNSGMGLGLSIVKSIIENCHGVVTFDTKYGSGTTFYIKLPSAAE